MSTSTLSRNSRSYATSFPASPPSPSPSLVSSFWNAISSILSLLVAICVAITTWFQQHLAISVLESRISKLWHYTEFFLNLSWALTCELFFYAMPSLKPSCLPTRCVSTSSTWRRGNTSIGATPSASALFEQEADMRMSASTPSSHHGTEHENIFYPIIRKRRKKFTLILDLDETLVHTTDKSVPHFDCRVEIHSKKLSRHFYILKRPFLDLFLSTMSRYFELVVFTASIRRYADAVIDLIDVDCVVERRFFRQACTRREGGQFVKDLSKVSKDLSKTIIIDNSPVAYSINQENAIPIETWYDDPNDTELLDLIPFLIALRSMDDVRSLLRLRTQPHRALMIPGIGSQPTPQKQRP